MLKKILVIKEIKNIIIKKFHLISSMWLAYSFGFLKNNFILSIIIFPHKNC